MHLMELEAVRAYPRMLLILLAVMEDLAVDGFVGIIAATWAIPSSVGVLFAYSLSVVLELWSYPVRPSHWNVDFSRAIAKRSGSSASSSSSNRCLFGGGAL